MRKLIICLVALCGIAAAQATYTVTISSGAAVSSEARIGPRSTGLANATAVVLRVPNSWTAADLLIEASTDGTTWLPVYDSDGGRYRIKVDVDRFVVLDASAFWGLPRVRFRSVAVGGTSDVNQGAARTLTLIVR